MPFTVSHAAAVLPLGKLSRRTLPLAALMIGSMSPDFSYFLPGELAVLPTHTFAGLFWFCWPAGMAAWLLFVHVLEVPTLALLPEPWRSRIMPSDPTTTLIGIALASLAVVIGAATHVIWDSFTHRYTPVVDALPMLRTVVFKIGYEPIRVYKILQHLSTVVGFLVLTAWAWRLRRDPEVPAPASGKYSRPVTSGTRLSAAFFLLATSGSFAITNYLLYADLRFERRLFHLAIGGMSGWMLAWCVIALGMRWKWRRFTSA
ncbi:MAG: DUF4184 family protein [Pseudomonadota bacterium]